MAFRKYSIILSILLGLCMGVPREMGLAQNELKYDLSIISLVAIIALTHGFPIVLGTGYLLLSSSFTKPMATSHWDVSSKLLRLAATLSPS